MSKHFWRQVLLLSAVAIGYLVFRGRPAASRANTYRLEPAGERRLRALLVIVTGCIVTITVMTWSAGSYLEHYARLDSLSWLTRRLVYV
jgi:hypothetical protein